MIRGVAIMVAINGFKSTNADDELVDLNDGRNDRRPHTWRLAEYAETKPKEQSFVLRSYGRDKKKGKNGENHGKVMALAGSDDVIFW